MILEKFRKDGGKGSGNFGHKGRPGEIGGSGDGTGEYAKPKPSDSKGKSKTKEKNENEEIPNSSVKVNESTIDSSKTGDVLTFHDMVDGGKFEFVKENDGEWHSTDGSISQKMTNDDVKTFLNDLDYTVDYKGTESNSKMAESISESAEKIKEVPVPSTIADPAKSHAVSIDELNSYPVGSVYTDDDTGIELTKQDDGSWTNDDFDDHFTVDDLDGFNGSVTVNESAANTSTVENTSKSEPVEETANVSEQESTDVTNNTENSVEPVEAQTENSEYEFPNDPMQLTSEDIENMPVDSSLVFSDKDGNYNVAIKTGEDSWEDDEGSTYSNEDIADGIKNADKDIDVIDYGHIEGMKFAPESENEEPQSEPQTESEPDDDTLPFGYDPEPEASTVSEGQDNSFPQSASELTGEQVENLPSGTQLNFDIDGESISVVKTGDDQWEDEISGITFTNNEIAETIGSANEVEYGNGVPNSNANTSVENEPEENASGTTLNNLNNMGTGSEIKLNIDTFTKTDDGMWQIQDGSGLKFSGEAMVEAIESGDFDVSYNENTTQETGEVKTGNDVTAESIDAAPIGSTIEISHYMTGDNMTLTKQESGVWENEAGVQYDTEEAMYVVDTYNGIGGDVTLTPNADNTSIPDEEDNDLSTYDANALEAIPVGSQISLGNTSLFKNENGNWEYADGTGAFTNSEMETAIGVASGTGISSTLDKVGDGTYQSPLDAQNTSTPEPKVMDNYHELENMKDGEKISVEYPNGQGNFTAVKDGDKFVTDNGKTWSASSLVGEKTFFGAKVTMNPTEESGNEASAEEHSIADPNNLTSKDLESLPVGSQVETNVVGSDMKFEKIDDSWKMVEGPSSLVGGVYSNEDLLAGGKLKLSDDGTLINEAMGTVATPESSNVTTSEPTNVVGTVATQENGNATEQTKVNNVADLPGVEGTNTSMGLEKAPAGAQYVYVDENGNQIKYEKQPDGSWDYVPSGGNANDVYTNVYSQDRVNAASKFNTDKEADDALRDNAGKVWQKASKAEKEAAYEYTKASGKFNWPLRKPNDTSSYHGAAHETGDILLNKKRIDNLTKIIDKTSLGEDTIFRRGEDLSAMAGRLGIDTSKLYDNNYLKSLQGKVITEPGFTSCGVRKGKGFGGQVEVTVFAPKGTKALYAEPFSHYGAGAKMNWDQKRNDGKSKQSFFNSEQEIILQRGTQYRVHKMYAKGGTWHVELEVVGQNPGNTGLEKYK